MVAEDNQRTKGFASKMPLKIAGRLGHARGLSFLWIRVLVACSRKCPLLPLLHPELPCSCKEEGVEVHGGYDRLHNRPLYGDVWLSPDHLHPHGCTRVEVSLP